MHLSLITLPRVSAVVLFFLLCPAVGGSLSGAADIPPSLDPDFKLGISYYGAFYYPWSSTVSKDFAKIADAGYTVIRVWATWCGPDCRSGSLVSADGSIAHLNKLNSMLAFAKNRNVYLDITFEPAQFTKLAGANAPYANYKKAIKNVAQAVKDANARSWVIMDVCNECMAGGTKTKPEETEIANTELTKLSYGSGDPEQKYPAVLRDLITGARDKGVNAFFSVIAGGAESNPSTTDDTTYARRAASYYRNVYKDAGWSGPAPLLAPHFSRKPCDSEWAERTGRRIFELATSQGMDPYPIYVQEENRRRDKQGCCGWTSMSPQAPTSDPCEDRCRNVADVPASAFYAAGVQAKWRTSPAPPAWAWVFHTRSGFGCADQTSYFGSMDAVETEVFSRLPYKVDPR